MNFTNEQIEQMRKEIENPELMKKRIEQENAMDFLVELVKARFILEGRDFDAEFKAWQKSKGIE